MRVHTKLILVKPNKDYIEDIRAYRQECMASDHWVHGSSGLSGYDDIEKWIENCRLNEHEESVMPGYVLCEQFMLIKEGENRILGMIAFRHYLNEETIEDGGHIGYSVRPSERRKGYAAVMLSLCLDICRKAGLDKVLITCDADNKASRRTILSLGGKFERLAKKENESDKDSERYWIITASQNK